MSKKSNTSNPTAMWISQNFLTNRKLIDNLLQKTSITSKDAILEIGPGKGHITRALLRTCGSLTAVEMDTALFSNLQQKMGSHPRLHLIRTDFLRWRLPAQGAYKVFSNIPFNHTTAMLRRLTEAPNPPQEAWLVMEHGAALRFLGKPRESLRSLLIKPRFEANIFYRFRRTDFHPAPAVDVVMLHLKLKVKPDVASKSWQQYEHFIRKCFVAGRLHQTLTKRQIAAALLTCAPEDTRSGTMLYVQWLCLFRWWVNHKS